MCRGVWCCGLADCEKFEKFAGRLKFYKSVAPGIAAGLCRYGGAAFFYGHAGISVKKNNANVS